MTKELTLPVRLDYAALDALYEEIKEARGEDIVLDAAKVTHLGSSGLQLLTSAKNSWDTDGHSLTIQNASDKFLEHLQILGLSFDHFEKSGVAA